MPVRHKHIGQTDIEACLAHRCDEHAELPPVNSEGPNLSECAICVAEAFVDAFEKKYEAEIFWPSIESAKQRLNLLAAGVGDQFVQEVRGRIAAARIDPDTLTPQ